MRKEIKKNNLKGFSLFEVLVTISILMLLSLVVFPVAINKTQETRLESYASQLATDIYYQQQTSYLKDKSGGVALGTNTYTLFDGTTLATSTDTDLKKLPENVKIMDITLTGINEITFLEGSFKPDSHGYLVITFTDERIKYKVYINREGLIGYEKI